METILIYFLVYVVVGIAFGVYSDALPLFRRKCRANGGITVGDIVKFSPNIIIYTFLGGLILLASGLEYCVSALEYCVSALSDSSIWNKQIIRCGRSNG